MANDNRFAVKNGLRTQNIDFRSSSSTDNILSDIDSSGTLTFTNAQSARLITVSQGGTIRLSENTGNVIIGSLP